MELGPKQEAWLKALESGEYLQGKEALCELDTQDVPHYCCLGVANVVCQLGERSVLTLEDTYRALGLKDCAGEIDFDALSDNAQDTVEETDTSDAERPRSLTVLNDSGEWDFKRIARLIRENPEAIFNESV